MDTVNEQRLIDLIDQLELFINGKDTDSVTTTNGQVPTLAAIAKKSKAIRYVLEARDFPNKASLTQAIYDGEFTEGQVGRIYKDPLEENNGFWIVDPTNQNLPLKTDLVDLYGLGPKDYSFTKAVIGASELETKAVARFKFLASTTDPFIQQIPYVIDVRNRTAGSRYIATHRGVLTVSYDTTTGLKQISRETDYSPLEIDAGANHAAGNFKLRVIQTLMGSSTVLSIVVTKTDPTFDSANHAFSVRLDNLSKDSFLLS